MRSDFRNIAVCSNAQGRVADIGDRNERGNFAGDADSFPYSRFWRRNKFRFVCHDKIELQINIQPKSRLVAFQLCHCLLEQLAIQIKTNRDDVAALSCAEKAAGATNLQVAHPQFKSSLPAKEEGSIPRPLDGRYAIGAKKHLPLPFQLAVDRSANDSFIVGRHHCFYRQTVERRGLNRGHVFYAYERKIESARNRRGRERQHIDQLKQLFEFLLVQNSEPLFLIDHYQAELFEHDVAGG